MGLCRLAVLGLLQVREGRGHDGRKSPSIRSPASCILHPVCYCNLCATGLWILGAGKLQAVQLSCTKNTLVLVYSFGTLHRGGVACRQSVSTMFAVVVLVHLLGSQ